MKKVLALTAGVLVALAPTGTAFAGESVPVPGKAYGNCNHSSSGGNPHTGLLQPGHNKGNGGLVQLAKPGGTGCVLEDAPAGTESTPAPPVVETPVKAETPVEVEPEKPKYDDGFR